MLQKLRSMLRKNSDKKHFFCESQHKNYRLKMNSKLKSNVNDLFP